MDGTLIFAVTFGTKVDKAQFEEVFENLKTLINVEWWTHMICRLHYRHFVSEQAKFFILSADEISSP